jgi:hypothetical protein
VLPIKPTILGAGILNTQTSVKLSATLGSGINGVIDNVM